MNDNFLHLQLVFSDPTHSARATCVDWSPDSTLFATGSLDQNLVVWKPTAPHSQRSLVVKGEGQKTEKYCIQGCFLPLIFGLLIH